MYDFAPILPELILTAGAVLLMMVAAGCARKVIFSYMGNPGVGSLRIVRSAIEQGKLEWEEYSHFGMITRLQAGASGLPFLPMNQTGAVDLVIGTHAILQEDVQFAKLGLVVIDEPGVVAKHGVSPASIPDLLGLVGDDAVERLPEGYRLDHWRPEYAGGVSTAVFESFEHATDSRWDPRFRTLLGSKKVVGMIDQGMMGQHLPACTSVTRAPTIVSTLRSVRMRAKIDRTRLYALFQSSGFPSSSGSFSITISKL